MPTLTFHPSAVLEDMCSVASVDSSHPYSNIIGKGTDSSEYAQWYMVTGGSARTKVYYSFDLSVIPANATIISVICKGKCQSQNDSIFRGGNTTLCLYSGTTEMVHTENQAFGTSATVVEVPQVSWTREQLTDCRIMIQAARGLVSTSTSYYIRCFGIDLIVTYEVPTYYTVSTSITGGTLRSPTVASTTVNGGANYEITFNGNPGYTLSSMTVNGVEVTPTIKSAPAPTLPRYTVSTNYGTYQTYALSNAYDGNNSTFFWSSEAQTQGKYILITFSDFVNLKSFSTYSSNDRDYLHPCNMLQVSADNENWTDIGTFSDTQTSTFSNITNANNIKYVRIYATSNIENWLVLNEITMSYESAQLGGEYYSYIISAIDSDKTVVIIFNEPDVHYIKVNGRWRKVLTAYRKVNGTWEEFNYTYDDSLQLKYLGHITSDIIGEVTTDYHIVITDTSVPNDTYYFYYEDANKTKLTDWDVIGSTEFNEYNGGTTTTGEEVGVINEDNSISLTNTSLATGTYTMYYENADGAKLEGWDSIGTVSK